MKPPQVVFDWLETYDRYILHRVERDYFPIGSLAYKLDDGSYIMTMIDGGGRMWITQGSTAFGVITDDKDR